MTDQYRIMCDNDLKLLAEIEHDPVINNALNITLPNKGEETDYDGWLEGSRQFANDNYEVLRKLVK